MTEILSNHPVVTVSKNKSVAFSIILDKNGHVKLEVNTKCDNTPDISTIDFSVLFDLMQEAARAIKKRPEFNSPGLERRINALLASETILERTFND